MRQYLIQAVFAILLFFPINGFGQLIEFQFNPPDGLNFVQTLKTTQTRDMGPKGQRTDVTESKTEFTVQKTAAGYTIVAKPVGSITFRDGRPYKNPLLAILSKITVTYELDPTGKLLAVKGFENLSDKLGNTISPSTLQALSTILNEQSLVNKEKAEWYGRYGKFVGRKAGVGEGWEEIEESALPTGDIVKFYSASKIEERMQCGPRICIKLLFKYNTNSAEMKDFLGKAIEGVTAGKPEAKPDFSDIEIEGGGERILDPSTMLIRSEMIRRNIKMKLKMTKPGQDAVPEGKPKPTEEVQATFFEEKNYAYEYPEAK